jgi:plasmid stabilization system protein ParE
LSYSVVLRGLAEQELREAQQWYEEQQSGLAVEFTQAIDRVLDRIAENPRLYPEIYQGARRAVCRPFPYLLWYRIVDDQVIVLACVHGKRDPRRIASRFNQLLKSKVRIPITSQRISLSASS